MQTQYLPMPTLLALAKTNSCSCLGESKLRGFLEIRHSLYVATGCMYRGKHCLSVFAYELLWPIQWSGEMLSAKEIYQHEMLDERRETGMFHDGHGVNCRGAVLVMRGPAITFKPEPRTTPTATKQLSLFDC